LVEVVHVAAVLHTRQLRQGRGVDARTADDDEPQARHRGLDRRVRRDYAPQQRRPYAGTADGGDHDALASLEAEARPALGAATQRGGVEVADVAVVREVLAHPIGDPG